jgi:hypothetical protein
MTDDQIRPITIDRVGKTGDVTTFGQKVIICALLTLVVLLVVLRPLALKTGPSGDFMTIFRQTQDFWFGKPVYSGGNPYLPSTYVVMCWQSAISPHGAWLAWRVIGIVMSLASGLLLYKSLAARLGHHYAAVASCNVLLLSGMSPWSGNPGNLAGIGCVLSYASLMAGSPIIAGIILGFATGLKYSLGLFFIIIALVARFRRYVFAALATFIMLNLFGLFYLATHGTSAREVICSLCSGVSYVGGFDESGFQRYFSVNNPYRFQLTNILPFLHSLGVERTLAHTLCLIVLMVAAILALYCAATGRPRLLLGAALFSPFFLLCTYHRFYDSALLAFPLLLSWIVHSEHRRIVLWVPIVCSAAFFLSISNIVQTRLFTGTNFLESWVWNYVIGPHHWFALAAICTTSLLIVLEILVEASWSKRLHVTREFP